MSVWIQLDLHHTELECRSCCLSNRSGIYPKHAPSHFYGQLSEHAKILLALAEQMRTGSGTEHVLVRTLGQSLCQPAFFNTFIQIIEYCLMYTLPTSQMSTHLAPGALSIRMGSKGEQCPATLIPAMDGPGDIKVDSHSLHFSG